MIAENETYLDMAQRHLTTAKIIVQYKRGDDDFNNIVAFHLAQSVELALKHRLEAQGIRYPHTHDISVLTELQGKEFYPELYTYAGTINLMREETRDVKNYRISEQALMHVMKVSEGLIEEIQSSERIIDENMDKENNGQQK